MGEAILWYEPLQAVLQDAEEATAANGVALALEGKYTTVTLQVTGTMTNSTINFEGSIDGVTFVSLVAINMTTGAVIVASGAAAGVWTIPVAGLNFFRARKSGTGTTAVTVRAVATAAPAVQVTAV